MKNKEKYILDYLQGKLNEKEVADFRGKMASDPELQAEVEDYEDLLSIYKDTYADTDKEEWVEEKRKQVEQWEEELEEENVAHIEMKSGLSEQASKSTQNSTDSKMKPLKTNLRILLAAASVAALILLFWLVNREKTINYEAIAQQFYGDKPDIAKTANPDSTTYIRSVEAFKNDSFDLARQLAEQVKDGPKFYQAKVILAHACFNQQNVPVKDKYQCAIDNFTYVLGKTDAFEMAVRINNQPLRVDESQVNWYLALSRLSLGEMQTAEMILEQLANGEVGIWQEKAEELLTDLRK